MKIGFFPRLAQVLIDFAKKIAQRDGKPARPQFPRVPVRIHSEESPSGSELTPRVRSMIGSLKGASTAEADYRRHLEAKYR
ncbi:MAG: hypothetical protein ACLFRG_19470 [Desulfococcaceae bacterium]